MRKIKKILINYPYEAAPGTTAYYFERAIANSKHYTGYRRGEIEPSKVDLILNIEQCQEIIKQPGVPSVYYEIDNHIMRGSQLAYYALADIVFIAQKHFINEYPPEKTVYIPLAADPEIHKPYDDEPITYDIGFCGNANYPRRRELLHKLCNNYKGYVGHTAAGEPYARALSRCKILFNCSMDNDVNMRFFEAMMIGRPLVSDKLPAQKELAQQGVHYMAYYDESDLMRKVALSIGNEKKRVAMGRVARNYAIKHHTYKIRLQKIIKEVQCRPCL